MSNRKKAVFNWSGGKDSALALYKVLQGDEYEVISLLTTVNKDNGRSTMHGIPISLLQKQANSIGIPLHIVNLQSGGEMDGYNQAMQEVAEYYKAQGILHFIFGDIFLHDVKSYREQKLEPLGIKVVEPLWGKSSEEIMTEFLASGLKTIIVTTTADILDESYVGRLLDNAFVKSLPPEVDVCGENGEYHTFCFDGGPFRHPVPFSIGKPIRKTYPVKLSDGSIKDYSYWFADLQDGCIGQTLE